MEKGFRQVVGGVRMDMSKFFDSVACKILFAKFATYGKNRNLVAQLSLFSHFK